MEYYSAIKNNKTTSFAATWIELETRILSEVSHKKTKKKKIHYKCVCLGVTNVTVECGGLSNNTFHIVI